MATKRRQRWLGYLDLPLSCETLYIVRAPSAAWKETILRGAVSASSLHATRTRQNSAAGGDGLLNRFRLHPLAGDKGEEDMASLVSSGLLISLVRQGGSGIGSKPLPPLKVCLFAATAANIDEVAEDDDLLAHVKPQKTPIVFADRPPPEKEKEEQRNALLDSIRQRRPGAGAAAAALDEETAREAKKTHHVLEVKLDASVLDSMAAEDVQARRRQSSGGEAERFVVHVHAPQRILVSQYWTDEEQLAAEERIGRFVLKWYDRKVLKKIKKKEERRRKGVEEMVDVHKRPRAGASGHAGPHPPHSTPHSHLPTSHPASHPASSRSWWCSATCGAPR